MELIIKNMYRKKLETDFKNTLKALTSQQKDQKVINNNFKEYVELNRFIRKTQIGFTQEDKLIGEGENQKLVIAARIAINFQKEIVEKSVAFEVGEAPTITPLSQNDLSDLVLKTWRKIRLDYKLQDAFKLKKSLTECAFLFNIHTDSEKKRSIKCKILEHKNGIMSPHFDDFGDMDAFTWEFTTKKETKEVKNIWIYDELNVYKYSDVNGTLELIEDIAHGFKRIPIVYMSQDFNEWKDVETIIDRNETSISRLVESNDYSGHPILALYGSVQSMADKDSSGKTLNFPIETTDEGKPVMGDAKFITNDNAPDAVKLELDQEKSLIYQITQTPNLSFDNLKGLGAISGVALELMFLDATLKAKNNEGENKTVIERCLNIITDGIVNVINLKLKSQQEGLEWDIKFNSILPSDIKTTIDNMKNGVEGGFISVKTAVEKTGLTNDTEEELELIKGDNEEVDL